MFCLQQLFGDVCHLFRLDLVRELGAIPVDYKNETTARAELTRLAPFDVILDCAKSDLTQWSDCLLRTFRGAVHISLINDIVSNTDRYGLALGAIVTGGQMLKRNLQVYRSYIRTQQVCIV